MQTEQETAIVIIGGGGDLAKRKLFPALFNLYEAQFLPSQFKIIGLARTERTNEAYKELVASAVRAHVQHAAEEKIRDFCEHILYVSGSFDEIESYAAIEKSLHKHESTDVGVNKIFYLAVPPTHYDEIFITLHESGIAKNTKTTWSRILVEKPFGRDLETALALEKLLSERFDETQIFRIDHYLAKESIMNVLAFRFANRLFDSAWNKEHIQEVRITLHESITVGERGAFYDEVGALRDVGQNHALQILALIAMEEPKEFTAEAIRTARASILKTLRPLDAKLFKEQFVRGQYDGYRKTPGVSQASETETYFGCTIFLNHDTWTDVPFYISAGKGLDRNEVSVEIILRDVEKGIFSPSEHTTDNNKIILTIAPVQSMNVTLNVKTPGHGFPIETQTLSFSWNEGTEKGFTAYEKILLDSIKGDQTLFTTAEEVRASWKFIASILELQSTVPLRTYEQGSRGPSQHLQERGIL